jgi:hypothetical protein
MLKCNLGYEEINIRKTETAEILWLISVRNYNKLEHKTEADKWNDTFIQPTEEYRQKYLAHSERMDTSDY